MFAIPGFDQVMEILNFGAVYPDCEWAELGRLPGRWAAAAAEFLDLRPEAESALVDGVSTAYTGHGGEAFVRATRPLFHGDASWGAVGDAVAGVGRLIADNAKALLATAYAMLLQAVATFKQILEAAMELATTVLGDVELPGVIALIVAFGRAVVERLSIDLSEVLEANAARFALVHGVVDVVEKIGLRDADSWALRLARSGLKGFGFSAVPQVLAEGTINPERALESAVSFVGGDAAGEFAGEKFGSWANDAFRSPAGPVAARFTIGMVGGLASTVGMITGSELTQLAATGRLSRVEPIQFVQGVVLGSLGGFHGPGDMPGTEVAGFVDRPQHDGTAPAPEYGTFDQARTIYRTLARDLHPDATVGLPPEERTRREGILKAATTAYEDVSRTPDGRHVDLGPLQRIFREWNSTSASSPTSGGGSGASASSRGSTAVTEFRAGTPDGRSPTRPAAAATQLDRAGTAGGPTGSGWAPREATIGATTTAGASPTPTIDASAVDPPTAAPPENVLVVSDNPSATAASVTAESGTDREVRQHLVVSGTDPHAEPVPIPAPDIAFRLTQHSSGDPGPSELTPGDGILHAPLSRQSRAVGDARPRSLPGQDGSSMQSANPTAEPVLSSSLPGGHGIPGGRNGHSSEESTVVDRADDAVAAAGSAGGSGDGGGRTGTPPVGQPDPDEPDRDTDTAAGSGDSVSVIDWFVPDPEGATGASHSHSVEFGSFAGRRAVLKTLTSDGPVDAVMHTVLRVLPEASVLEALHNDVPVARLLASSGTHLVLEDLTGPDRRTATRVDTESPEFTRGLVETLARLYRMRPPADLLREQTRALRADGFPTDDAPLALMREFLLRITRDVHRIFPETAGRVGLLTAEQLDRRIDERLGPTPPERRGSRLIHGDIYPPNIITDGRRVWLIDWELARVGNPMTDLAQYARYLSLNSTDPDRRRAEFVQMCVDVLGDEIIGDVQDELPWVEQIYNLTSAYRQLWYFARLDTASEDAADYFHRRLLREQNYLAAAAPSGTELMALREDAKREWERFVGDNTAAGAHPMGNTSAGNRSRRGGQPTRAPSDAAETAGAAGQPSSVSDTARDIARIRVHVGEQTVYDGPLDAVSVSAVFGEIRDVAWTADEQRGFLDELAVARETVAEAGRSGNITPAVADRLWREVDEIAVAAEHRLSAPTPVRRAHTIIRSDTAGSATGITVWTPQPRDRARVLLVGQFWDPWMGGVPMFNRRLAEGFAAAGHDVYVQVDEDVDGIDAVPGITVLGRHGNADLGELPDGGVDLIVAHTRFTGRVGRMIRDVRFPDATLVHVVHSISTASHGVQGERSAGSANERVEKALVSTADVVVGVGPVLAEYAAGLAGAMHAVPLLGELVPGLEFVDPLPIPEPGDGKNLYVSGRLEEPRKGFAEAADMVRILNELGFDRGLTVRGAPRETVSRVKTLLSQRAHREVTVLPYTVIDAERREDLAGACLVLMPSRAESFGMAVTEALAAGVPPIVPSSSGAGRLLADPRRFDTRLTSGLLVPQGFTQPLPMRDWVNTIAYNLRDLPGTWGRVRRIRRKAHDDNYTWRATADHVIDLHRTFRARRR